MALENRSLDEYQQALEDYKDQLQNDIIVKHHIKNLSEKLVEENVLRVVQPYSKVQVEYVAQKMKMDSTIIEKKLCQMILDKKINGILDYEQNQQVLVLFEEDEKHPVAEECHEIITQMSKVVDHLYRMGKSAIRID